MTAATIGMITTATEVAVGTDHACALLQDRTVQCWGNNFNGTIGNGQAAYGTVPPTTVAGVTNAIGIAAGGGHSCALLSDHSMKCWGGNQYGELGDGTTTRQTSAVPVSGITDATAIAAGGMHTCAVLTGGTVQCWGYLSWGASNGKIVAAGVTGATKVVTGDYHSCALLSSGQVSCWGASGVNGGGYYGGPGGSLGDGGSGSSGPVLATGVTTAVDLAAFGSTTCAVLTDHTVKCWGNGAHGQLGLDPGWNPVNVVGL